MKKYFLVALLLIFAIRIQAQTKSYKRGISYGYHSANDIQKVASNISWWYNWATNPEEAIRNTYNNYGVDFTPMSWNGAGIGAVRDWVSQDPNVKYILGFNEPNFIEQANMTPSQAASRWPTFQAIADDYKLKTVGPAVNYCGNCVTENGVTYNNPFDYLDDFLTACVDCRVDHIALHWYGGGNSIMGYIEEARKYGRPIWVTEFASWDGSVNDLDDQKNYLAGTVNFLERDPDIYRYSWFVGRTESGSSVYPYIDIYGLDGQLTELGQLYMDIPVYDPDRTFEIPGKIEVEEYYLMSGLFTEITSDGSGFLNIGWTDKDDWAEYKIVVQNSGLYHVYTRVAGTKNGTIEILIDNQLSASINTPNTGDWQNWATASTTIDLEAGEHVLKIYIREDGFNLNWIEISENPLSINQNKIEEVKIYPNPIDNNGIVNIEIPQGQLGEVVNFSIYDIFGKLIFTKNISKTHANFQLNTNQLKGNQSGVYIIEIEGEKFKTRKKLFFN